jgi:hypothetical protein
MYSVWLTNWNIPYKQPVDTLDEAITLAKASGFECTLYQGVFERQGKVIAGLEIVGGYSPINGFSPN